MKQAASKEKETWKISRDQQNKDQYRSKNGVPT
jgi:hypothetical protein